MIRLKLPKTDAPLEILCLGAHSDDIEIGCGGSIIRLLEEYKEAMVHWIVFSSTGDRADEAGTSAELFLEKAGRKNIIIKDFRDGFFPYIGYEIKDYFEEIKKVVTPDIIFTHFARDLHQDHRLISELTWNTFRNHLILEYEIIKYDGDLSSPNVFIQLNGEDGRKKIDYILRIFKTQGHRGWFTEDAFLSIMRIRGLESNAPERFAEAFYCRKIII